MDRQTLLSSLTHRTNARSGRASSWDTEGRNADAWHIKAGETAVLADIRGPGCITHIWMTQSDGYRNCVLKIYWDGEKNPSVNCPLGDFFCLGHGMVNSFQSLPFTASAGNERCYRFDQGCALNCYLQMPFHESARVEIVNEGATDHGQYFYIDYETYDKPLAKDILYFHAQFRRENPTPGWGHEIMVNTPEANIVNKEELAWENNYVLLDAEGAGHYIGCNISVANFQGTWWGEGDDMIWVDGYKWPPDLHGTGSEDYFNQAWGMQPNAYLRNGSSIWENDCKPGGYQTSYVFHLENPVRFTRSIKATIEHGHGNHLANDWSSVAYWYQTEPHKAFSIPPVTQRQPVPRANDDKWLVDKQIQTEPRTLKLTAEMKEMKEQWKKLHG